MEAPQKSTGGGTFRQQAVVGGRADKLVALQGLGFRFRV